MRIVTGSVASEQTIVTISPELIAHCDELRPGATVRYIADLGLATSLEQPADRRMVGSEEIPESLSWAAWGGLHQNARGG